MIDANLSRYIWTHTRRQQIWILFVVAASMIPYFMSFNLPKQIVNGPILGQGFEGGGEMPLFMRLAFTLPGGREVLLFPGIPLDRMGMLFALSGVFLALVIVNGLFKLYINTYKGKLGERMLRRLRFTLVDHLLRFPPATFRKLKPAEVATMVKDEVEPLGGFTGDAFVAPAFLGGQALTALAFIFVQSVPLGLITLGMVGVQVLFIPRMRRRLLVLGRERQLTARELAGRVSEIVEGIHTIRTHDTTNWERADVTARLGRIFRIRFDIYQWKFLVKFINNLMAQITPFLFYSVGGYLALTGRLDVGQLVAVIAAYRDLPGPLKELIDWDQARQDVQIKYAQVVTQFSVEELIAPDTQGVAATAARLTPPLGAVNLGVTDDTGHAALQGVSFRMAPGETVALMGTPGSGSDVLAEALVRVVWPTSGRVVAGEADLRGLPDAVVARDISYAGPDPFFFFGTVRDNLLYGLRNAPLRARDYDAAGRSARDWEVREALRAGNPDLDPLADWINYAAAGTDGEQAMTARLLQVMEVVGLTRDVQDLALRSPVDPATQGDLPERLVALRGTLRARLAAEGLEDLIAPFTPGTYNAEATVIENLLFGLARVPDLMPGRIAGNPAFRAALAADGLDARLYEVGLEIARTMVELFGELAADNPLLQSQTLMTADDLPAFRSMLGRLDGGSQPTEDDRTALIALSFDYIEPRYRFGLSTEALRAAVCAFRDRLPVALRAGIEPYDPARAIVGASLLDNLLFGRVSQKYRDGAERVYAAVAALLPEQGLQDRILAIGLDFHVGQGGKRLSAAQRARLALARALLRRSAYYIFNRPLAPLDPRSQEQITRSVLEHLAAAPQAPGVAWVLSTPAAAPLFDRVAVFDAGRIAEDGTPAALAQKNGIFRQMMAS